MYGSRLQLSKCLFCDQDNKKSNFCQTESLFTRQQSNAIPNSISATSLPLMLSPVNVKIQKLAHYFFYVTKIYKKKEKENSVHLLSRMFSIFVELKNSTE